MKNCIECQGEMEEKVDKTPEGVKYTYFHCKECGEEVLNMQQLHAVAEEYRYMKKYNVKLSKWGMSIGLRIPKDLTTRYHFKDDEEVTIIPKEKGMLVLPA